jgi:hypothetical protein
MVTVLVDPKPGDDLNGVDHVIDRVEDIGRVVQAVVSSH